MSPTPSPARDVPHKTKECGQKNTVCITAVELEKNVTSYDIFFFNVRTYDYDYYSSMEA